MDSAKTRAGTLQDETSTEAQAVTMLISTQVSGQRWAVLELPVKPSAVDRGILGVLAASVEVAPRGWLTAKVPKLGFFGLVFFFLYVLSTRRV